MGLLYSKWRKRDTSKEILESLEKDIQALESSQRHNEQLRKKFIGSLIIYSILVYVIAAVIYYFYYFPKQWKDRIIRSLPLLIFPILVYLLKRVLHYVFVSRMAKNATKLEDLKAKKKQVLEEVMEKETYKTAKELLEKFDPNYSEVAKMAVQSPGNQGETQQGSSGTELRQRSVASPSPLHRPVSEPSLAEAPNEKAATVRPGTAPNSPSHARLSPVVQRKAVNTMGGPPVPPGSPMMMRAPGPPKPQYPILPRERTNMDKFVEYIIGDGPSNRYALICKECFSHNGMALKEDFEYITFRCCYCFNVNPARKHRPTAPKLESFPSPVRRRHLNSTADTQQEDKSDKAQKKSEEEISEKNKKDKSDKAQKKSEVEISEKNKVVNGEKETNGKSSLDTAVNGHMESCDKDVDSQINSPQSIVQEGEEKKIKSK